MKRPILLMLLALLLGAGLLAGCGGDDDGGGDTASQKEQFDEGYKPINDEFVAVGNDVGQAVQTAKGKSNQELATTFGSLATRVLALKDRLTDLDPPDEYKADADRLARSMDVVAADLSAISDAAERGDADDARTRTQGLFRHSVETRTARRTLARKTGAQE